MVLLKPRARKHANCTCLHKLFFLTSKMAKEAKQNVHWSKETAFCFVWLVLREGNQTRFELFIAIL